jgi:hypothetical protein
MTRLKDIRIDATEDETPAFAHSRRHRKAGGSMQAR